MALTLEVREQLDVLILNPQGNMLENTDGDPLFFELENFPDVQKILIDCSQIKHLNSTGINVLLKLFTQIRNRGGELVLCALPNSIEKLLIITKLNSIFSIFPDVDAALRYFKNLNS
jgi:anti-sigma B factor antagonist